MYKETQLNFITGLYKKDNDRLHLSKEAERCYRLSKYVYSRVEEHPDDNVRKGMLAAVKNLMYDLAAMKVVYDPDGDCKSLEQIYDDVAVLPLPYRYTYVFPTIEQIHHSVDQLLKNTDRLTHVSKKYFNSTEIKALGMLFDNIDLNIVKLTSFLNEKKNKERGKV